MRAEAQERAQRLEAALSTYGGVENAETASLKDMIRRAKGQAKIPPPADRIKSCEEFLGRSTRRLEKAEEEVAKAIAKKQSVEAEITRAQSDLARMREELSREPIQPRCSESDELERLRGLVAQFERERDARENVSETELTALRSELEELRQFRDQYPACTASALQCTRADASRAVAERSTRMELMIEDASAELRHPERFNADHTRRGVTSSNRFNPLA